MIMITFIVTVLFVPFCFASTPIASKPSSLSVNKQTALNKSIQKGARNRRAVNRSVSTNRNRRPHTTVIKKPSSSVYRKSKTLIGPRGNVYQRTIRVRGRTMTYYVAGMALTVGMACYLQNHGVIKNSRCCIDAGCYNNFYVY